MNYLINRLSSKDQGALYEEDFNLRRCMMVKKSGSTKQIGKDCKNRLKHSKQISILDVRDVSFKRQE